ncbi:MAG: hypothetical protein QW404_00820 [Candidatus Nanoarchaeia archaeon]
MDIKFIRDDTEEKAIKELNEILETISVKQRFKDVNAAKRFMLGVFRASKPPTEKAPIPSEHLTLTPAEMPSYAKNNFGLDFSKPVSIKPVGPLKIPIAPKPSQVKVPIPPKSKYDKPPLAPSRRPPEAPTPSVMMPSQIAEEKKEEDIPLPPKEEVLEFEKPFLDYEKYYPLTIAKDRFGVALVRSTLEKAEDGMVYNVVEPAVDAKALSYAKDYLMKDLRKKPQLLDDEKFIKKKLEKAMKKVKLPYSDDYADKLKYYIRRDSLGFGKVDALLQDPKVKSVMCDGLDKPVKVFFDKDLEVRSNVVFSIPDELNSFVKHLASKVNHNPKSGPNFEGVVGDWKVEGTIGFGNISSKFIIRRNL